MLHPNRPTAVREPRVDSLPRLRPRWVEGPRRTRQLTYREGGGYLSLIHNLGNDRFAVADFDGKWARSPSEWCSRTWTTTDSWMPSSPISMTTAGLEGCSCSRGSRPRLYVVDPYRSSGEYPEGIAGGDFDGDGRADVAIASSGFGKVEVWKNESLPALGGRAIATVLSQAAAVESVEVVWQAPGVTRVTVERSLVGKQWQPLAQAHMDREGHLRYVDRTVSAGGRYRYRLASRDPGVAIDGEKRGS